MRKNILYIAYYFPPLAGSGVQRTLKFIKYLPMYNKYPVVVTVKEGHNFAYDEELIKEVPDSVKVYRSNSGENLWLRKQIENANKVILSIKKRRNLKNKNEIIIEKNNNKKEKDLTSNITIKDKIFKYLEYNYYIPDTKVRWYKNAVKDVFRRVLKNEEIDLIFSTSAPYTDHLIALEIKKKTNKPWVVDLRDPWVGNKFIYDRYDEKRKAKEIELEAEVIKYADKVINVTEDITNMYIERYPEYKEKFITITNGFDISDRVEENIKSKKFIINYSGIVVDGQSPEIFLKAVEELILTNSNFKEDLLVNFTGSIIDKYTYLFENENIKDNIKINGYKPHDIVLKEMKESSINLLILPDTEESKGIYSGKIFDYILSEKPILGIMPLGGVASELINSKKIGIAVEYNDLDAIRNFIEETYVSWKNGTDLNTSAISICNEFDRINLTKRLSDVFDELM
ncbi:MAG: glycosyltransferase [Clostridium sp.]|uniref:glycosyltransferase n=1 Tax=Clostridium sp. TaxID=1506 RepID=UPI001EC8D538|nr:glycosyltransferase [Clostridium sp.]MBS5886398.1 glycosyltransferase [Clostridium sp.]MDU7150001.1 glycosyltransferase [Clostridium sp.]MDU7243045.1 glycosyltransferase [Clostridium sp.]